MKWKKLNELTLTNGIYNIVKHPKPEMVPFPYSLCIPTPLKWIGHYKTAAEAMEAHASLVLA